MLHDYSMERVHEYMDEAQDEDFEAATQDERGEFMAEVAEELEKHMRRADEAYFTHAFPSFAAWLHERRSA